MTPAQARALRALQARSDRLAPEVRQAFLRAIEKVGDLADLAAAEKAIAAGDVEGAMRALFGPEARAQFAGDLNVAGIRAALSSAQSAMRADVPAALRVGKDFFRDAPTPAVIEALKTIDIKSVTPIVDGTGDGLREVLRWGMDEGLNPRQMVHRARSLITLTEYDVQIVRSFEEQLRTDPARALTRTLRDGRFDKTIEKALGGEKRLTDAQIGQMRLRYAARLQDWRTETASRTLTINSYREGQLTAWRDAADANAVSRVRVIKEWVTTLDGRERPTHHEMHGTRVPIDQPFDVPGVGPQMTPGESEYNCRCSTVIRVLPGDGTTDGERFVNRSIAA